MYAATYDAKRIVYSAIKDPVDSKIISIKVTIRAQKTLPHGVLIVREEPRTAMVVVYVYSIEIKSKIRACRSGSNLCRRRHIMGLCGRSIINNCK
jgi:hypothetical protein